MEASCSYSHSTSLNHYALLVLLTVLRNYIIRCVNLALIQTHFLHGLHVVVNHYASYDTLPHSCVQWHVQYSPDRGSTYGFNLFAASCSSLHSRSHTSLLQEGVGSTESQTLMTALVWLSLVECCCSISSRLSRGTLSQFPSPSTFTESTPCSSLETLSMVSGTSAEEETNHITISTLH